jgi:ADP-heptose:LPS heptosyltransferase
MSLPNPKTAAVFISSGLGDALLLIPLVKTLKEHGYLVTAIVTSPFPCEELFSGTDLFQHIVAARGKAGLFRYAITHSKCFDLCILNYFACSRSNLLAAKRIAHQIHTNRFPEKAGKRLREGVTFLPPQAGLHDAEQNILLAGLGHRMINEELMSLRFPTRSELTLPPSFIVLQISAANNKLTYKNWPVKYWIRFLSLCRDSFPHLKFVLLGEAGEVALADEVIHSNTGNVINLAGKTTVFQAMEVISRGTLFLGLDGGLLHAAVVLGKPSFSIWGPSNPLLYGYEKMNPAKHRVISLGLLCAPCSAWIMPNTSRVSDPEQCPDHKCLMELKPDQVFGEFSIFVRKHAPV